MNPAKARLQNLVSVSAIPDDTLLNPYADATFGDLREVLGSLDRFELQLNGLLRQCEAEASLQPQEGKE